MFVKDKGRGSGIGEGRPSDRKADLNPGTFPFSREEAKLDVERLTLQCPPCKVLVNPLGQGSPTPGCRPVPSMAC